MARPDGELETYLTLVLADQNPALAAAHERRLEGLLPARFHITEAALMEETEPDRWSLRETFPLG
jgi:hypothetical protein